MGYAFPPGYGRILIAIDLNKAQRWVLKRCALEYWSIENIIKKSQIFVEYILIYQGEKSNLLDLSAWSAPNKKENKYIYE